MGSNEEARIAAEAAQRERLVLAISDMDDVAAAARWLHATHWEVAEQADFDDIRLRLVMEAGLFATYARAFNKSESSDGRPGLPAAPTSGLDEAHRAVHNWALERRKKTAVHVDRDSADRATSFGPITIHHPDLGELHAEAGRFERYRPPTPGELLALAELAEHLAARYRAAVFGSDAGG